MKDVTPRTRDPKTFTRKQVFFAILPWAIIVACAVFTLGAGVGWTGKSNIDSTIHAEVVTQVQQLKQ